MPANFFAWIFCALLFLFAFLWGCFVRIESRIAAFEHLTTKLSYKADKDLASYVDRSLLRSFRVRLLCVVGLIGVGFFLMVLIALGKVTYGPL